MCKLKSKSKKFHLCIFKIHLEFLMNSSNVIKSELLRKKKYDLDFTVKWLLHNRSIHFLEAESDSFLVLSFQWNRGCNSQWEHLSFEKGTVKIECKSIFRANLQQWVFNLALFETKQSKQSLQSLLTLSVHLKYVSSNYLPRVGLFYSMLNKGKHSSWDEGNLILLQRHN